MNIGHHLDGRVAFQSRNLRGLIDYARKHGIVRVYLGECISHDGRYEAQFGNGVICKGAFASPSVMLGFFLGRGAVNEIVCERTVFNQGAAMGRIRLARFTDIGRDGTMKLGPWTATAYRDEHGTALVKFTR